MATFTSTFLLRRLIQSTSLLKWSRPLQQNYLRICPLHRNLVVSARRLSDESTTPPDVQQFDEKMLQYLACPLSKKPLRYDKEAQELICDETGVAYPIINGIPNLTPQDARQIVDTNASVKT